MDEKLILLGVYLLMLSNKELTFEAAIEKYKEDLNVIEEIEQELIEEPCSEEESE